MREHFFELSDRLARELRPGETLLCNFAGERSDFVRFNQSKVRQAGSVEQRSLSVRLLRERRQASATLALGVDDFELGKQTLGRLREVLGDLPEDPWLLINETPHSTSNERRGALAPAEDVVSQVIRGAEAKDLVGFYAAGTIYRGFANSLGQRNWHAVDSFNFDWSQYLRDDKAVKTGYAGFEWDEKALQGKIDAASQELGLLENQPKQIEPGEYRVYLAPRALDELTGMLAWGGFSARARATKQSPLLRMQEGATLAPMVSFTEKTAEGVAPGFQSYGFVKTPVVNLIEGGKLRDALVSARSAKV
jgi:predicted Zn-dependent protease